MLVVYMMYDIIVLKNLRSRPCTRRREASVLKNLHFEKMRSGDRFFSKYVWKKSSNKTGYVSIGNEYIRYMCVWYAKWHDLLS